MVEGRAGPSGESESVFDLEMGRNFVVAGIETGIKVKLQPVSEIPVVSTDHARDEARARARRAKHEGSVRRRQARVAGVCVRCRSTANRGCKRVSIDPMPTLRDSFVLDYAMLSTLSFGY